MPSKIVPPDVREETEKLNAQLVRHGHTRPGSQRFAQVNAKKSWTYCRDCGRMLVRNRETEKFSGKANQPCPKQSNL